MNNFNFYLNTLYKLASQAIKANELPISAIIVDPKTKKIIAKAHNKTIKKKSPLAHAELIVIEKSLKKLKRKRLNELDIYCSLEPCAMCSAALSLAKVRRVYFCVEDKKSGGFINGAKVALIKKSNHKFSYYYGFDEERFSKLLKNFFKVKRC
jgi:tRNA(adenine34) deaminase